MAVRRIRTVGVAVLALLVLSGARCDDDDGGSAGDTGRPSVGGKPTSPKPKEKPEKSDASEETEITDVPVSSPPGKDDESTGMVKLMAVSPDVRVEGKYNANCSALDIRLTIEGYGQRGSNARWTALALDYDPAKSRISEGNIRKDIVFQPPSGTLAPGAKATVRVTGKYAGLVNPDAFWIVVQAPVDSGNFVSEAFRCDR